jgi:hypothetical protein
MPQKGPLGTLIGVINYFKAPKQYETFSSFLRIAIRELKACCYALELLLLSLGTRPTATTRIHFFIQTTM